MGNLQELLRDMAQPDIWQECLALGLALCIAFGLTWLLRKKFLASKHAVLDHAVLAESVWFGIRLFDGLMFPLLALVFTYGANRLVLQWQPLSVLKVAVPMLIALVAIRFIARTLSVSFPNSALVRVVEQFFSWLAWLIAILWIVGLLPQVLAEFDGIELAVGKRHISLRTILEATFTAGLVIVVTLWLSSTIERRVLRDAVSDLSMRKISANAVRAILLLLGLLFALSAIGVDLTALSVLGGALGVGLGLGLQKLASNYVSGFVILFERSVRIGDNVKVDGFEGRVTDIKTRYTLIRALNGREAVIPNEKLITERVENLSLADPKVLLVSNVTVGYASDVAQVQSILSQAALNTGRVLKDPEPVAHLANFGADGLEFSLCFWISDPQEGQLNVRSEINIAVLHALRAAGIDIPYPQRVVHSAVISSAKAATS